MTNDKCQMINEFPMTNVKLNNLGFVINLDFDIWFLTFMFEACSVAEHDSIPSPIRWAVSGKLRGKEDVGLSRKQNQTYDMLTITERKMC